MDQTVRHAPILAAAIKDAMDDMRIIHNPYFETLRNGHMSLHQFKKTQEQFFYTVDFFPRSLSTLIARLTNGRDRLAVLHIMVLDNDSPQSVDFPSSEFKTFLKSLGCNIAQIEASAPKPEVKAFNNTLAAAGAFDELECALACLGTVSFVAHQLYPLIGEAIIERGWLARSDLSYYKTNENASQQNPEVLLSIIAEAWNDANKQKFIRQGIELGLFGFNRLFRDLVEM